MNFLRRSNARTNKAAVSASGRRTPWRKVTEEELSAIDLYQFLDGASPYGEADSSLRNAFQWGKAFFDETVRERVNFVGGRVLDLLCGFGRWIPALAETNAQVVGLDRLGSSINLADKLCAHFGIENVKLLTGDISRIKDLEDCYFDSVWMWSGLQYVERAYALRQIHRVLKPGGRIFVGAYNGTGLMLEHVLNGAHSGTLFSGASKWALSALAHGPQADGNPNFMDLSGCDEMCGRFGFKLIAVAPQDYLDLRNPGGQRPGLETAPLIEGHARTIEFLAEKL